MGEIFLDDGDIRLYQGDVEAVLAGMPDESVDCVVTSPPYWGLRDYGTGGWDGGDPECDHVQMGQGSDSQRAEMRERAERQGYHPSNAYANYGERMTRGTLRDECGKCGARRVDQQLGLEPTPDLYVERIVAVFREVRRVLAAHGTCWVNLGDSYASGEIGRHDGYNPTGTSRKPFGERQQRRVQTGLKSKDLVGIPWRVAFALQADGWWLRADIIWAKPNPMPESVTDRPTKAHEYVFLLTKQPRYYFDQEAVREPHSRLWDAETNGGSMATTRHHDAHIGGSNRHERPYPEPNPGGRNVRSVWQIATQPYPEAHFATYPEELVRRCVLAGCPERVCRVCGKPSERIVESEPAPTPQPYDGKHGTSGNPQSAGARIDANKRARRAEGYSHEQSFPPPRAVGWSECDCLLSEGVPSEVSAASHADASFPVAPGAAPSESKWRTGVVLDPFIGSGTTAKVARDHGRHSIGIDLSADYLNLAARRLQQLSLLT